MSTANISVLDRFFADEFYFCNRSRPDALGGYYWQVALPAEEIDLSAWFDFERYETDFERVKRKVAHRALDGLQQPAHHRQPCKQTTQSTPVVNRSLSAPPTLKGSLPAGDELRLRAFYGAREDALQRRIIRSESVAPSLKR